jgi:hypothetical protein
MFELTLVDHLRLTFGHVVQRHKAHSQLARTRFRWSLWLRTSMAVLVMGTTVAAVGAAFGRGPAYAIASAVLASLALVALLLQIFWDLEGSAHAHATCAAQLALVRERYRALLSDLSDGAIDADGARARRDALMSELSAVYEHAPWSDAKMWRAAAQVGAAAEERLTDEQIDRLLPESLHRAERSTT